MSMLCLVSSSSFVHSCPNAHQCQEKLRQKGHTLDVWKNRHIALASVVVKVCPRQASSRLWSNGYKRPSAQYTERRVCKPLNDYQYLCSGDCHCLAPPPPPPTAATAATEKTTTIITSAAATTAAPLLCCHSQSQVCLFAYITCYSCVQTQNQTSTCCTCMCVYVYCTYTYTYAYTCMYVCMYVIIHASMHAYRLRHLRIPARKGRGRDEACGRHDCRFIHRCRRSIISALIL